MGKSEGYIRQMRDAAKVFNVTQNIVLEYEVFQDKAKHLAAKLGLSLRNDNLTWSHHKEGAQHAPGCVLSDVKAIGYSALPKAARNGTGRDSGEGG